MKLALAQMRIEGGKPETNLARASRAVSQAASNRAEVIVLPEALDFGWTHGSAKERAQGIPDGSSCKVLCAAAAKAGMHVCAGLIERDGKRLFNAAVLISPGGEVILHHRKLNELELAHDLYSQGDRLEVVTTPPGVLGVMICADAFAPGQVVSRALGMMGADIILSPCAWAVPSDHDNAREPYGQLWLDHYGPVARDFGMWIAGASNVGPVTDGPWKGRKCIGCSLLVGPRGDVVARGPYGEEAILYADVEVEKRPPWRGALDA